MAGKTAVLSVRILGDGKDARRALKGTSKDVSLLGVAAKRVGGGLGNLTKFAGGFSLIGTAVGGTTLAIKAMLPVLAAAGAALVGALAVGAAGLIVPLRDIGTVLGDLGPKFSALGKSMSGSFWAAAEAPIRSLVDTLLPSLSEGLTETSRIMGDGLGAAAERVQSTLGPMLPDLLGKFNEFWSGAMAGLGPMLDGLFQLMDAGSFMLPLLGDGLATLGSQFAGWATQMNESGQVASLFQTSLSTISSVFETLAPAIGSVIGLFETTYSAMAPVIGALASALAPAISAIATALGPVVQSIAGALLPVVQQLAPIVGGILVTAVQALAGVFVQLAPVIGALLQAVIPFVAQIAGALLPVIVQLVQTLLPPLVALFSGLAPILGQVLAAVMPLIATLAGSLSPLISALGPLLMTLVQGFLQVIGAIAPLLPMLVGILVPVIQTMIPIITQVATLLTGLLASAFKIITGVIDVVVGILTGDWEKAWDGMQTAASGAVDLVLGIVKGIPDLVLGALGDLGSLLLDSGKALMQGLADGITNGIKWATNAASDAVSAIRDFFPFSPAKRGPFSGRGYTTYSGKALVGDFAGAMTKEIVSVERAARAVAKAGTFKGGFDMKPLRVESSPAPRAASRVDRPAIQVNFNNVVTDRLGVAREIRKILAEHDRLVVSR